MLATIQFKVDARRSKDTEALAVELERIFRERTIGDGDLDSMRVIPKSRGGAIIFFAKVEDERDDIVGRVHAIGAAVDTNANLVDRVDGFIAAAHSDNKIVCFSQGDFRGWIRENVLADLRETRS